MTNLQVQSLKLGIEPIDDKSILIVESALEWVLANTTLKFDINNEEELKALPSCVRLFITKFVDINMLNVGVTSESIEGLSQSFSNGNIESMIWDLANSLLGSYLKSRVRFVTAERKWR